MTSVMCQVGMFVLHIYVYFSCDIAENFCGFSFDADISF